MTSRSERKPLKDGLDVATLGLEIGLALLVGIFLGRWLDSELEIAPWGKAFGFFLAIGASVKSVVRVVRKVRRQLSVKEVL